MAQLALFIGLLVLLPFYFYGVGTLIRKFESESKNRKSEKKAWKKGTKQLK